ncbi:hypothetical protein Tco_1567359, partial [Tanacetum coccineum]
MKESITGRQQRDPNRRRQRADSVRQQTNADTSANLDSNFRQTDRANS